MIIKMINFFNISIIIITFNSLRYQYFLFFDARCKIRWRFHNFIFRIMFDYKIDINSFMKFDS